jgi:hypothetical protein
LTLARQENPNFRSFAVFTVGSLLSRFEPRCEKLRRTGLDHDRARRSPPRSLYGARMSNPTVNKRQKEKNRQDKQRDKDAKRRQRRDERAHRAPGQSSLDAAIADIVPGPQPPSDDA